MPVRGRMDGRKARRGEERRVCMCEWMVCRLVMGRNCVKERERNGKRGEDRMRAGGKGAVERQCVCMCTRYCGCKCTDSSSSCLDSPVAGPGILDGCVQRSGPAGAPAGPDHGRPSWASRPGRDSNSHRDGCQRASAFDQILSGWPRDSDSEKFRVPQKQQAVLADCTVSGLKTRACTGRDRELERRHL